MSTPDEVSAAVTDANAESSRNGMLMSLGLSVRTRRSRWPHPRDDGQRTPQRAGDAAARPRYQGAGATGRDGGDADARRGGRAVIGVAASVKGITGWWAARTRLVGGTSAMPGPGVAGSFRRTHVDRHGGPASNGSAYR